MRYSPSVAGNPRDRWCSGSQVPLVRDPGARGESGNPFHVHLFGHLKFDPPSVRDACRRVEDLYGYEVSPVVVVEDDARLVLVALGDGHAVAQNDRDDVRPGVVRDLHDWLLQYFATLLVRYAVTTRRLSETVTLPARDLILFAARALSAQSGPWRGSALGAQLHRSHDV